MGRLAGPRRTEGGDEVTVRYASHRSYEESVLSGLTSDVRRKVMTCLYQRAVPMTRHMIEVATGIRISTVTSAVFGMLLDGQLEVRYQDKDPISGRLADFVAPVSPEPTQERMGL